MKRWEEQQRKKLYNSRISQAKPTLNTQAKKPKTPARVVFEEAEMMFSPEVYSQPTFQSPLASPVHPISFSIEPQSTQASSQKRQDLPIFQLLRAFKLQQYA